jgi:3-hydroxyisobutyrate dehydrogenase
MEEDGLLNILAGTNIMWIDHTSTEPSEAVYFGEKCTDLNVPYVEAPLTGGLSLLQKGQMTVYLGGPKASTDAALSVVKHYSATQLFIGDWGAPATVKIVSNMMCAANTAVMGEAMTIFRKENISLDTAFDAIRNSAGNTYVWETEAPLAMNGTYEPGFTLELHNKDLTIGEKMCEKHDLEMTMFQESTRLYREGMAMYGDQAGSSHPAKMIAEKASVQLDQPGFEKWTYSIEKSDNGRGMSVKHEQL